MGIRNNPKLDEKSLWEYALRVLSRRAYSIGEIRQKLLKRAQSATDIYEKGRSNVARQRDTLNAAVEAGKQAYREAVGDAKAATATGGHVADNV